MIDYLFILPFIGLAIYLFRYFSDQSKNFSHYIEPDLEKYGFELISSSFFKPKFMDFPFGDLDEDVSINPLGGKYSVAPRHVHSHLRKVKFKAKDGKRFDAIAAIEFKDSRSKEFKRVRWKPDLQKLCNINRKNT
jgi:hypothetical protein